MYPFVVPLRPIAGSLLEDHLPPSAEYMESVYRRVVPYLQARGIGAAGAHGGMRPLPGLFGARGAGAPRGGQARSAA